MNFDEIWWVLNDSYHLPFVIWLPISGWGQSLNQTGKHIPVQVHVSINHRIIPKVMGTLYIYLLDFLILRDRIVSYHIIPWFHVFPCNFIISYHFISFLWVSYVFSVGFPMFFLWFCIISIDPTIPIIFTSLRSWSIRISHLIPGGLPGSRRSCGISNTSQIRNKWKRIFLPQWLSDLGDLSET